MGSKVFDPEKHSEIEQLISSNQTKAHQKSTIVEKIKDQTRTNRPIVHFEDLAYIEDLFLKIKVFCFECYMERN